MKKYKNRFDFEVKIWRLMREADLVPLRPKRVYNKLYEKDVKVGPLGGWQRILWIVRAAPIVAVRMAEHKLNMLMDRKAILITSSTVWEMYVYARPFSSSTYRPRMKVPLKVLKCPISYFMPTKLLRKPQTSLRESFSTAISYTKDTTESTMKKKRNK